jgi:hypothetical protein
VRLTPNAKRAGELFVRRLKLHALGARFVPTERSDTDEHTFVGIECPEHLVDEVQQLMTEHGYGPVPS